MVKKLNIDIEYYIDSTSCAQDMEDFEDLLKNEINWALRNKIDSFKDSIAHESNGLITKDHIYINII